MTDFVLNDFLPYQLAVLSARASRAFSQSYREEYGISISEWRVVAHLSQVQGPVSVREIFQRVDMGKPKVSRAASRLEKNGYVVKSKNPDDGRLIDLCLSKSGHDMVAALAPKARAFEQHFLAQLGQDKTGFVSAIDTLLAGTGSSE